MSITTDDANVVTAERAVMLAAHAIYVQGGFSTPEIERERAEKGIAAGEKIDWETMQNEVTAAMIVRTMPMSAEPTVLPVLPASPPAPTADMQVDVTAILAEIDLAIALRARIAELTAKKTAAEDAIKKVLGMATEGVDATGNVVVRLPYRSRHGLDKKKVKAKLTPTDFADCSTVTNYRTLLFGSDES